MSLWSRGKSLLRNLFRRNNVERQLDEEFQAYIAILADEKAARGMPAEEARRRAMIELGGTTQVKQAVRETRTGRDASITITKRLTNLNVIGLLKNGVSGPRGIGRDADILCVAQGELSPRFSKSDAGSTDPGRSTAAAPDGRGPQAAPHPVGSRGAGSAHRLRKRGKPPIGARRHASTRDFCARGAGSLAEAAAQAIYG